MHGLFIKSEKFANVIVHVIAMRNRKLKLKLHKIDPRCYWCKKETVLPPKPNNSPFPSLATIDHIYSRFDIRRFVEKKPGEIRRVLACYECNQKRAREEEARLTREEITLRGQGFSFNKRGQPIFTKGHSSLKEVVDTLKIHGIIIPNRCMMNC